MIRARSRSGYVRQTQAVHAVRVGRNWSEATAGPADGCRRTFNQEQRLKRLEQGGTMPLFADNVKALYAALVVAAISVAGLILGKDVLIPLVCGTILAFVLAPLVGWLSAHGIPRPASVTAVIIAVVSAVIAISALLSIQLVSLTAELGTYKYNLVHKSRTLAGWLEGDGAFKKAAEALATIERDVSKELGQDQAEPSAAPVRQVEPKAVPLDRQSAGAAQPASAPVVVTVKSTADDGAMTYLSLALHPAGQAGLAILFALFMLLQSQDLRDRIVRIAGTDNLSGTTAALNDAASRLSQLFLYQAVLNIGFGAVVGLALWIIGVPNALLWAGLTMVMRFVPYVGSIVAAVPPVLLAAAVDPGWSMAVAVALVFLIGEPVMGHVVEPLVLGKKAGLSPFAMISAASFWALIWGPIGLILAAPITMSLVVLGRYVNGLEFLSVLLGDEPALNAEQEFYHRLLSGDPLAAADQLETAIDGEGKDLAALSDDIVLPAMRLAAVDVEGGRVDKERTALIRRNMSELGDELDILAAPGRGHDPARVLVIPARTLVDVTASEYVARAISASSGCAAVAAIESVGLTAISQAAQDVEEQPDAVVLTSTGGIEAQHLALLWRRMEKSFSGLPRYILDIGDQGLGMSRSRISESQKLNQHRRLATLLPMFKHLSDRTAEQAKDAGPATGKAGELQSAKPPGEAVSRLEGSERVGPRDLAGALI